MTAEKILELSFLSVLGIYVSGVAFIYIVNKLLVKHGYLSKEKEDENTLICLYSWLLVPILILVFCAYFIIVGGKAIIDKIFKF